MTRDVSEGGVFLETDWDQALAPVLDLEFEIAATPTSALRFVAQGSVLRREPLGPKLGVAVRLLKMRIEPVE